MSIRRKNHPVIHTATSSRPLIHRNGNDGCENEPPALDTPTSQQMTLITPKNSGKTIRVFDSYSRQSIGDKPLISPSHRETSFQDSGRGSNQQSFSRNGAQYSSSKARQIRETAELVKLPSSKSMLSTIASGTGHVNPFNNQFGQSELVDTTDTSDMSSPTKNMFDLEPMGPSSQLHNSSYAQLNSSFNAGLSALIRNDSTLMQRTNTSLGGGGRVTENSFNGSRFNDSFVNTPNRRKSGGVNREQSLLTPISTSRSRSAMHHEISQSGLYTPRHANDSRYAPHHDHSLFDSSSITANGSAIILGATHAIDVNYHNATCVMAYINELNVSFFNSQYNDHFHRDVFQNTRNVMLLINRTHENAWVPNLPATMVQQFSGDGNSMDASFTVSRSFVTTQHNQGYHQQQQPLTTPQKDNLKKITALQKAQKSYETEQLQQHKNLTVILDHEKQVLNRLRVKLDTLLYTNVDRLTKTQKKDYEKELKEMRAGVKEHEREIKKLSEKLTKEVKEYTREMKKYDEKMLKLQKTQTALGIAAKALASSSIGGTTASPQKKGFISRLAGIAKKDSKKKKRRSSSLNHRRSAGSRLSRSPQLLRAGHMVSPLSPRACQAVQTVSRNVPFVSLLQHPIGSRYFFKALEKEYATENFHFWRDVHLLYGLYSDLCDIRTFEYQKSREKYSMGDANEYYHNRLTETALAVACIFFNAAQILIDTYVIDSSMAQVNIASGRRSRIISSIITLAEAFDKVNLAIETAADDYARDIEQLEATHGNMGLTSLDLSFLGSALEHEFDHIGESISPTAAAAATAPDTQPASSQQMDSNQHQSVEQKYSRRSYLPTPMDVINEDDVQSQHSHGDAVPYHDGFPVHTNTTHKPLRRAHTQTKIRASNGPTHNNHPDEEFDQQFRLSSLLSLVRINFDSAIGEHIELVMESFLSAASEIEHLMARDSFPRFKASEQWVEMVAECIKQGQSGIFMNAPLSTTNAARVQQQQKELSTFSTPVKPSYGQTTSHGAGNQPSSRAMQTPLPTTPTQHQPRTMAMQVGGGGSSTTASPYDQKRKYNYFRKHLRSSIGTTSSTATNPRRVTINKKRLSQLLSPSKANEMKLQIQKTISTLSPKGFGNNSGDQDTATQGTLQQQQKESDYILATPSLDPTLAPTTVSPSRRRRLSMFSPATPSTPATPCMNAKQSLAGGAQQQGQPSTPFAFGNSAIPYATARLLTIKTSPTSPEALLSIVSECSTSHSPGATPANMMPTSLYTPMSPRLTSPVYGRPNPNHPHKTPRSGSAFQHGGFSQSGFLSPQQAAASGTPQKRAPRAFFAAPPTPTSSSRAMAGTGSTTMSSVRILSHAFNEEDEHEPYTAGASSHSAKPMPTPVLTGAKTHGDGETTFYGKSRSGKGVSPLLSRLQRLDNPEVAPTQQDEQTAHRSAHSQRPLATQPDSAEHDKLHSNSTHTNDSMKKTKPGRQSTYHRNSIHVALADFIGEEQTTMSTSQHQHQHQREHHQQTSSVAKPRTTLITPSNSSRMNSHNADVFSGFKSPFQFERQRTIDPQGDLELSPEISDTLGGTSHVHHPTKSRNHGGNNGHNDAMDSRPGSAHASMAPNQGRNSHGDDADTLTSTSTSLHNRYMLMKARFNRRISTLEALNRGASVDEITAASIANGTGDKKQQQQQHAHLRVDISGLSSTTSSVSGNSDAMMQPIQGRSDSQLSSVILHDDRTAVQFQPSDSFTTSSMATDQLVPSQSNTSVLFSPRSRAAVERESMKVTKTASSKGSNRLSLGPMMYNFSSKKNVEEFAVKKQPIVRTASSVQPTMVTAQPSGHHNTHGTSTPAPSRKMVTSASSSSIGRSPQINFDALSERLQRHMSYELDAEFDALMKEAP